MRVIARFRLASERAALFSFLRPKSCARARVLRNTVYIDTWRRQSSSAGGRTAAGSIYKAFKLARTGSSDDCPAIGGKKIGDRATERASMCIWRREGTLWGGIRGLPVVGGKLFWRGFCEIIVEDRWFYGLLGMKKCSLLNFGAFSDPKSSARLVVYQLMDETVYRAGVKWELLAFGLKVVTSFIHSRPTGHVS